MSRKTLFLILLIATGFSLGLLAQNVDPNAISTKVDSLLPEAVTDSSPGLVIGVVHNSQLIFSKGYGMANMAYGIKNSPAMAYNLGSVSKQFLGYAFAMLAAEKKIKLDDRVNKHLPNWPEFNHEVTISHLLSHVSGYREAYTMSELAGRTIGVDRLTKEECLNVVRNQPELEFVPGGKFSYNSTAYVILAEILESVTKQPADQWVEKNILKPLGMNHTYIESYVGEVIPNAAESYFQNGEEGYMNPKSNRAIFGAADVYTSVEDMVLWMNNFRTAKVGGEKARAAFLKTFMLNDGSDSEYALGISVRDHKGAKLCSHTGSHEAFLTQLRYYPESDIGIITMSNYGGSGWIDINELAEFILKDIMESPKDEAEEQLTEQPEEAQEEQEQLSDAEVYRSQLGDQEMDNDSLNALLDEKNRLAAITDFPNEPHTENNENAEHVDVSKPDEGSTTNNRPDLKPLAGIYRIIGGNQTVELKLEKDTLVAWGDYKLIHVSDLTFRVEGWHAKIEFVVADNHVQLQLIGDKEEVYDRLAPWNPSVNEVLPYTGDFWSQEAESVFHLLYLEDKLILRHRWMDDIVLAPLTNGLFSTENGWLLEFELTGSEVVGFHLHAGRTSNVFFQKR